MSLAERQVNEVVKPGQCPPVPCTLAAVDLGRVFGGREVFSHIAFQVGSGQVHVVTGPNGSGKSTLLRIAAGLLSPSAGRVDVVWNGRSLDGVDRRECLGYVAPDLTLYRELTGAENLRFFARLRGVAMDRPALVHILSEVGLKGRGRDLVGTYSSGMRQRLKYAFALLGSPVILLLDEPTANLDAEGIAMVERLVAAHRMQGGLTVIGTNEPREVGWGDAVTCLGVGN